MSDDPQFADEKPLVPEGELPEMDSDDPSKWHLIVKATGKGLVAAAYAEGEGASKQERAYNAKKRYVYGSGDDCDMEELLAVPWPDKLDKSKGLPWYPIE